jgi:AraC-like DNA-binding protein
MDQLQQRVLRAVSAQETGAWSEPSSLSIGEARFAPTKIAALVEILTEQGIAAASVLDGTGLSDSAFRDPNTLTSPLQFLVTARNALRLYRGSDLGVRLGTRLHATSYGMYGYALLCSETMGELFNTTFKYHRLANGMLQIRLVEEEEGVISWELPARDAVLLPHLDESLYWFLLDLQFCVQVTIWKDVMGSWCVPARVAYSGPQPIHAASLAAAVECPIAFDQPRHLLSYPSSWSSRKPQLANPVTASQMSIQCARLLEDFRWQAGVTRRVYQELTRTPGRFPGIEEIASLLCMTSRTLRRKLDAEGTSFSDLLVSVRKALAVDYLSGTGLSTDDIAAALGFSDVGSFRHAFKRWTSKSPNDYRRPSSSTHKARLSESSARAP